MKGKTERHKNGEVCKAHCSFIPFYKGAVIPEGRPGKAVSAARDFSQQSVQYWKGLRLWLMIGTVWEQFLFKELPPTHQCLCSLQLCQQGSACDLLRPPVRVPCPAQLFKTNQPGEGKRGTPWLCQSGIGAAQRALSAQPVTHNLILAGCKSQVCDGAASTCCCPRHNPGEKEH